MTDLLKIFISAMLIENPVLIRFLALCPFMGMSTDVNKAVGMGGAVIFVTVLATAVTYPIFMYVLRPLGLEFLETLVFILVIASLVQLVEFYLKKSAPALYGAMGVYLALITTNCTILAVTLDVISNGYTFVESLVYAIGTASGFLLALVLMAGIREKLETAPLPKALKGPPSLFITAALLSMSFGGFSGMIR